MSICPTCGRGATIDDETRRKILRDYAAGMRQVDIADKFGISQGSVSKIVGVSRADRQARAAALAVESGGAA